MYDKIREDIQQDYYVQNFPNEGQRFVAWYLRNIHLRDMNPNYSHSRLRGGRGNERGKREAKADTRVQNLPLPSESGINRSRELLLTKSVPEYFRQMSVARRWSPGSGRRTAMPGEARWEMPIGDAVDQPLPEGDDRLG